MKKSMASLSFLLAVSLMISAQDNARIEIPVVWTNDFVISLHYHNSMGGSSKEVLFTFDSCIIKEQSRIKKPSEQHIAMKQADRNAILKTLNSIGAKNLRGPETILPVHDGWSQSLQIGATSISGGSDAQMSEENKILFLKVYHWLEGYAAGRSFKE